MSYSPPPYNVIGNHDNEWPGIPNHHHSTYDSAIPWWGCTESMWNVFYSEDFYPVYDNDFEQSTDYYHGMFGEYLRQWFDQATSTERTDYTSEDPSKTASIVSSWTTFLNDSTNIRQRRIAPFLWVYNLLNEVMSDVQEFMIAVSDRLNVLSNSQQTAINALSALDPAKQHSGNDYKYVYYNDLYSKETQVYLAKKNQQSEKTSGVNTAIQSTQQSVKQEGSLMSSIISQIQGMVSGIFK